MTITTWAEDEMEGADFGDARLHARAERVLSVLGQRPNLSIPAACGGRAEMHAAYRFFDNDKVTFDKILRPHQERTRQRMAEFREILLPQDTTELDLTRPESVMQGVGELDGARQGILLHLMHAVTPDGTPLGTVYAEILNRPAVSHDSAADKRKKNQQRPIEQKESRRWLTGLRQARELAQQMPQVRFVCLADSEGDIYELFAEARGEHPVEWLIRACQDRVVGGDEAESPTGHLRECVLASAPREEFELLARGRRAKTTAEDRTRRQDRDPRRARVEVRATTVTLRPPPRPDRVLPPVAVNAVLVREQNPPAGESPVEWLLLTTLPIESIEDVRAVVDRYCVRWNIEVFFRTLKSGCRVEQKRFEAVERLLPYLGICLIVAWRTLFVSRLGRECPEVDCEVLFEPAEWQAVWSAVYRTELPAEPPRLGKMVRLIAQLGGYVDRPGSDPGAQTVWIGLQRMYDLAWAWEAFGPPTRKPGKKLV